MEYWPAFTQKINQIMVNIPARSIWDVFSEPKPTRRQETGRWPHVRFRLDLHLGTLMCIAVKDSKGGNNSTIPSGNLTIAIEHGHLVRCFIYISGWWFGTWFFIFPYIGKFMIPIDELYFFQRGRSTSNQLWKVVIFHRCLYVYQRDPTISNLPGDRTGPRTSTEGAFRIGVGSIIWNIIEITHVELFFVMIRHHQLDSWVLYMGSLVEKYLKKCKALSARKLTTLDSYWRMQMSKSVRLLCHSFTKWFLVCWVCDS